MNIKLLEEYRNITDASCIVSEADATGKILYVNDKFCEISGYAKEDLIGKSHNIVRHPDTPLEVFVDLWGAIKAGKMWEGTIKNRKKDGSAYFVKTTIQPVLDSDGTTHKFISVRIDVTDIYNMSNTIKTQTTDQLTGLPNRQMLMQDLRGNQSVIFALVNIDGFKNINEVFGHDFGDKVLIAVGDELLKLANEYGLYRVTGDEFAILDNSVLCLDSFHEVCSSIISRFQDSPLIIDDFEIELGVRIGATGFVENPLVTAEIALRKASEIKSSFAVVGDTKQYDNDTRDNIEWVKKIKEAIRNDKVILFAQKIVPTFDSTEASKCECLVRMMLSDGSIAEPSKFLDRARKAKLYSSITKAVIEKSFAYFSKNDTSFSINLSIEDLLNRDIVKFLNSKLNQYNIANRLIVEIVESEAITDFEYVNNIIKGLKARGVKIAIDDFGSGYSNFDYIIRLNADFIKIDGSLVRNIHLDPNSYKSVGLIIMLAKSLGIKSVAEFVHSEEVLEKLRELKVDYLQGYHIHKPAPLEEL